MEVSVYRGSKKKDTYILVREEDALERVPEALLSQFGEAALSFSFTLTDERKMPRVDPVELRLRLIEDGFYLQLPPPEVCCAGGMTRR